MNAYLLFDDGTSYPGIVKGNHKNSIGNITLLNLEKKSIQINGQTIILCEDDDCIQIDFMAISQHLAKIIVDSLPLEFHLYDLKTAIA
jgi:hypothetical protein